MNKKKSKEYTKEELGYCAYKREYTQLIQTTLIYYEIYSSSHTIHTVSVVCCRSLHVWLFPSHNNSLAEKRSRAHRTSKQSSYELRKKKTENWVQSRKNCIFIRTTHNNSDQVPYSVYVQTAQFFFSSVVIFCITFGFRMFFSSELFLVVFDGIMQWLVIWFYSPQFNTICTIAVYQLIDHLDHIHVATIFKCGSLSYEYI